MALKATVEPASSDDKTVKWVSSDKAIATVTASGSVKAIAPGNAKITVTTNDGGLVAECDITVNTPVIPPETGE